MGTITKKRKRWAIKTALAHVASLRWIYRGCKTPDVPLTVSPLNPEAQGGDLHAASGFPLETDLHTSNE